MLRILLAGAPRSGTSWVGETLGRCEHVTYVDEPDGFRTAYAFRVMLRYGENPVLTPGASAPEYERLWSAAWSGGREPAGARARVATLAYDHAGTPARRRARAGDGITPSLRVARALARPPSATAVPGPVVAKSVQCARSLEWIVDTFDPVTVVLSRHPLNAIASWRALGFVHNSRETTALADFARSEWDVRAPAEDAPTLAWQAFVYGVTAAAFAAAAARHPEWVAARHEDICRDPLNAFRALAERLGLAWSGAATEFVQASDRAGTGFATARVAAEQESRWRERLSESDVDLIRGVLAGFPDDLLADC